VTTTAAAAGTRRHTETYPAEPRQVGLARAALAAWLFTAAAGAYLFAGWRAGGGPRRPRRAGLVPVTVLGHVGLAVAGLGIWVAFVITAAPVLAWLGVGLIVLIALGESIVALGVGAGRTRLDAGIIAGALLGIATAAALWWAYFDVVAIVAERRLRQAQASEQARIARDSYTYLHLPIITGIIVFAIGVKRTLEAVDAHLAAVPATALCGGVALYLLSLSAFKRRNVGSFNLQRLLVAAALVALVPAATVLPAIAALGLVATAACGLIAFEYLRYAEARERVSHGK